jgi:hypothetical protein
MRYQDKEYGFSVLLPRTWKREKESGPQNTIVLVKSVLKGQQDKFQENISLVVSNLAGEVALDAFFELNKNEAIRLLKGMEDSVSEGEISLGRIKGRWLSFKAIQKGLVLKVLSASWIKGNRVYVLSCSAEAKEFFRYEPIFKKTLYSFRIR